jgi:thiamine pyrophosphate-dependent acetolactate synthase large subunit-like protein
MVIGAAIALESSDRVAVGIIGDGDFVQGCTALWTAAHERIPFLLLVARWCMEALAPDAHGVA